MAGTGRPSRSPGVRVVLLTIGHSNHTSAHLLALLRENTIDGVADVRSWPASRHAPWFDRAPIAEELERAGIRYAFLGRELGGRPADPSLYDAEGRVRYDAVAATEGYKDGVRKLRQACRKLRIAVMCAEENPQSCHRRLLVARVLYEEGMPVLHIRGDGRVEHEEGFSTRGTLFEESLPWRSTASVSPRRRQRTSSAA